MTKKKDWAVTLSYNIKHDDTYLIRNETKEGAIYIAENQNSSPRYDCTLIKEDKEYMEDEETTIKEVK
jgi:spore coat polysaccharide biosynthesis predicted glycosyltransferase SpsG